MPRASSGFSGSGGRGAGGGYSGGYGGGGHYHRHYGGGFFFFPWRRPYYGYGGGFFGGLFGLFFLPIILLLFAGLILVTSVISLISVLAQGGVVQYDRQEFQNYAKAAYAEHFDPKSTGYEDNLLIFIATVEGYDTYHAIGVVGDNINDPIYYMFDEGGAFDAALYKALPNEDYNVSFDRDLRAAIYTLETEVLKNDKIFLKSPTAAKRDAEVIIKDENLSDFPKDGYTYEALESFSEKTGINVVLIIQDEEAVFGRTVPASVIISGILSLIICIFAGVWIYKSAKARKRAKREQENRQNGTDYNDPRYWN